MKKCLLVLLKGYAAVCVLVISTALGGGGYKYALHMQKKVTLPNGFVLKPTLPMPDRTSIYILDPDGKMVVDSAVGDVMWCNDVVYGVRYSQKEGSLKHCAPTQHLSVTTMFIYDHSEKRLQEFETSLQCKARTGSSMYGKPNSLEEFQFNKELTERGLPEFDYHASIRYLDVVNGLTTIDKNEVCRK